MKRIKLLITAGLLLIASINLLNGQEKRNEQKIKVVIDKGSGKETVIDTVFNGDKKIDSLKLKNGEVIYLNRDGDNNEDITVSYNKKEGPGEHMEVRKDILVTDNDKVEKRYKVISKLENGCKPSGERYVTVIENGPGDDSEGDIINYRTKKMIISDGRDNTRYIISKDGITVTIEGTDDARIQQLVKEIEKKLDIGKNNGENKGTDKEAGTTVKKK